MRVRTVWSVLIFCVCGCGGGGGGGSGANPVPATSYSISGTVARSVNGAPLTGVSILLTGAQSATTTTDSGGNYRFNNLPNGSYVLTPVLAGTVFDPDNQTIVVSSANIASTSFEALSVTLVASGVEYLPASYLSSEQLRVSLLIAGGHAITTDSSEQPLKSISLLNSASTALSARVGLPEAVALNGQDIYWIDGEKLNVTSVDGLSTSILVTGERDSTSEITTDLVADTQAAYWVNTISSASCSPACTWVIQRVPLSGGNPTSLATVDRPIVALAADDDNIYWQESSSEPWTAGCGCGSSIKRISKTGGPVSLIVDGSRNGTLPVPAPGFTPGSWQPTGGLAVNATQLFFASTEAMSYRIDSVPITGGAIANQTNLTTSAGNATNAIRDISINADNIYWIDTAAGNLYSLPIGGSTLSILAAGISIPFPNESPALVITSTAAFWTERGSYSGCCLQAGTGRIRTVDLNGGAVTTLVSGLDGPAALAVDALNLVWTEFWRIAKSLPAGGPITTLASGISSNLARITSDHNNIYILDGDLVKWLPISGGTVEKLAVSHGGNLNDFSQQNHDITTDGSDVFWTFSDVAATPQVNKVSITTGVVTTLVPSDGVVAGTQDCYRRITLAGGFVYWSAASSQFPVGCTVRRVAKTGGGLSTPVDFAFLRDFTVDGTFVYFSEFSTAPPAIRKTPVTGGASTIVATEANAWVLTHDDDGIYWLDTDPVSGGIGLADKNLSDAIADPPVLGPLATDPQLAADAITITADGLYWTESVFGNIYAID